MPPQNPDDPNVTPVPGRDIEPHWTQIAAALSSIQETNDKLRQVSESTLDFLQSHRVESAQAARAVQSTRRRQSGSVPADNQPELDDQIAASQQELERLRNEAEQRNVSTRRLAPKIESAWQAYAGSSPQEKAQALERMNIFQGKTAVIGGQSMAREAVERAMQTPVNERTGEQENLLEVLNKAAGAAITEEVVRQAPSKVENILDAVEEAGIRQLRYGQLPLQDILRSAGTLSGRIYERYAPPPNIPGMEQPAGPQEERGGIRGTLERYAITRGAAAGLGAAGLSTIAAAARFLPVIGSAIAVGQVAAQTFGNLYAKGYQSQVRSGQLTGEGWSAGMGAQIRGTMLGLNPFDMISAAQGAEIVQAVRERGMTGRQGVDVMFGIRGVVNDLGISIDQAATFFEDSMRRGGMSVEAVRKELQNFDDNAHALNMNINDYTQQILSNTQTLRAGGAGGAAPQLSQALLAAVPVAFRRGEGQQILAQAFEQNRGTLAAIVPGANINTISSARYIKQGYAALDDLLQRDIEMARANLGPGATPNDIANQISQTSPFFRGVDTSFLQTYILRGKSGRGISGQLSIQTTRNRYAQEFGIARGQQRLQLTPGSMTDDERRRLGIRQVINTTGRGGPASITYSHDGRFISPETEFDVTRLGPMSGIPINRLRAMNQEAIDSIRPILRPQDLRRFEENIGNRKFDMVAELNKIALDRGRTPGSSISTPVFTIQLKPGVTQKMFEVLTERTNAINSGALAPNKNPTPRWP